MPPRRCSRRTARTASPPPRRCSPAARSTAKPGAWSCASTTPTTSPRSRRPPARAPHSSAHVVSVTLAGSADSRELWTLTVNGARFAVEVDHAIDTLERIAVALASAVNAGADPNLFAMARGESLVLLKRDGPISASVRITPAAENTDELYDVDDSTASAVADTLSGAPVHGATLPVTPGEAPVQ